MTRKENWTDFGRVIHKEFLDKDEDNIIPQKKLAEQSGVRESAITRMISHPGTFAFGQTLYDQFYAMLKALDKLDVSISEKQVRELLATIPDFPSIHLTDTQKDNLIDQLTEEGIIPGYETVNGVPIIGREREIRSILTKLIDKKVRFLCLTGMTGVGKSELAHQIRIHPATNGHFACVVLHSFNKMTSVNEVIDIIIDHLQRTDARSRILLILEDCEKIIDTKNATYKIAHFIEMHPQLTILATSQVTFGREEFPVVPLEVPHAANLPLRELLTYEAFILFCNAAWPKLRKKEDKAEREEILRTIEQHAQKIAALCIGLDGLPLAIILIALCVKKKTIDGVYTWLEKKEIYAKAYRHPDDNTRHETLTSAFTYSYSLLTKQAQWLFEQLSIFAGGCQFNAVEAICYCGEGEDIDNFLWELSEHNLILFEDNYISMRNSLHDFAEWVMELKKSRAWLEHLNSDPETVEASFACAMEEERQLVQRFVDYYYHVVTQYMKSVNEMNTKKQRELEPLLKGEVHNVISAIFGIDEIVFSLLWKIAKELTGNREAWSFLIEYSHEGENVYIYPRSWELIYDKQRRIIHVEKDGKDQTNRQAIVWAHPKKVLNPFQPYLPGFSAMFQDTSFSTAIDRTLNELFNSKYQEIRAQLPYPDFCLLYDFIRPFIKSLFFPQEA